MHAHLGLLFVHSEHFAALFCLLVCTSVSPLCACKTLFNTFVILFARTHIRMSSVCTQDTFQLYAFALTLQLLNLISFAWRASVAYPQTPRAWVNKLLDTLTYSAPASIPTIFLVLTYIARMRLDKAGISLLYSKALHVGAYVNLVCFDKTGTLTDSVVSLFFLLLHCQSLLLLL